MGQYKNKTIECVDQAIQIIKQQTNRDVLWSTVAYEDCATLIRSKTGLYN
jgi:nitrogen regulatory protein PII-like uncharacterized protein